MPEVRPLHYRPAGMGSHPEMMRTYLTGVSLVAGGIGVAGLLRNPRNVVRGWKYGAGVIQSATELQGLLPALGSSHKVGARFGSQEMTTLGRHGFLAGMPEADLPVPMFGVGLTSVPTGSSRLIFELNKTGIDGKSRGDQQSLNMKTREVGTRKTMRGPSAKKKPRMVRRRGSRCPPGYRYDAKRGMCIQNT